jgi:hypothetical protein
MRSMFLILLAFVSTQAAAEPVRRAPFWPVAHYGVYGKCGGWVMQPNGTPLCCSKQAIPHCFPGSYFCFCDIHNACIGNDKAKCPY